LVEKIRAVIESEKVDPKYIEIEVTETSVMTNIQSAIDVLEQFRKLGIQFSIDDFGAG
jgi:EAL domain-containing protein (putative c-di-GMP-specific phosphodiesterase class I)